MAQSNELTNLNPLLVIAFIIANYKQINQLPVSHHLRCYSPLNSTNNANWINPYCTFVSNAVLRYRRNSLTTVINNEHRWGEGGREEEKKERNGDKNGLNASSNLLK